MDSLQVHLGTYSHVLMLAETEENKNSLLMSQSIPTGCIPPGQPPGIRSKNLPGGSGFDFRKLPGGREFDKDRDFVENES